MHLTVNVKKTTMTTIGARSELYGLTFYLLFTCTCFCEQKSTTILFLGDSLTAGYGIEKEQAYPALIKKKINEFGRTAKIINAGISGNTTAGGLRRIKWYFREHIDILLIALGGNDGLRGLNPIESKNNIQKIIVTAKETFPNIKIIIAGMQMPPNMGKDYTVLFQNIFTQIAAENNLDLVPFLLEGVGGIQAMNLADGIHPNQNGHRLLCDNVWKILKPLIISSHIQNQDYKRKE